MGGGGGEYKSLALLVLADRYQFPCKKQIMNDWLTGDLPPSLYLC